MRFSVRKLIFGFIALLSLCATAQDDAFVDYRQGFCLDTLALQVHLDRLNISCNCVDGVWGAKTAAALMTWQVLNGSEPTGVPTGAILEQMGGGGDVLTHHTLTDADLAEIVSIPSTWEGKAELSVMGFESLQEMMAEKGHSSVRAVERLNPDLAWPNPPVGSTVVLPACDVGELRRIAGSVRIALGRREVTVFDHSGKLIALFPCSIARSRSRRPTGEIHVRNIAVNPNYLYDPQLFNPGGSKIAKFSIPPGPNNPVGLAWIGLSLKGYGIHGTPAPERIGEAASHGCFRLSNWNARKLIQLVEIGTPVVVED